MAIRLSELGGTDWSDGEVLYSADLNDTGNRIVEELRKDIRLTAENNIAILRLEGANSLETTDFTNVLSDYFTDANGIKNTVSSYTTYFANEEHLNINIVTDKSFGYNDICGDTRHSSKSVTTTITAKKDMIVTSVEGNKTENTNYTVVCEIIKNGNVLASKSYYGNAVENITLTFSLEDYNDIIRAGDTFQIKWYSTASSSSSNVYYEPSLNEYDDSYINVAQGQNFVMPNNNDTNCFYFSIKELNIDSKYLNINIPSISGTVKRTMLFIRKGDDFESNFNDYYYELSDGTNTDTNLQLATLNNITNLTSNPTSMKIVLDSTTDIKSIAGYVLYIWVE